MGGRIIMLDETLKTFKEKYIDYETIFMGIEHQLKAIDYQRYISSEKNAQVAILPKNIDDISVGDMVYVSLDIGFPNEMWYGHWCYVLKDTPTKFLVVPAKSKHHDVFNEHYMEIDTVVNNEITKSILCLNEVRFIDKQRIDYRKGIAKVLTPKSQIRKRVFEYLEG